jgi:hypothetical protein
MKARSIATICLVLIPSIGIALAQDNPGDATQRVTGCLKKAPLTCPAHGRKCKLWGLQSKNISFSEHVGRIR